MISTTCKSCTYKIMSEEVQTGCEIGILGRFVNSGADISTYEEEGVFKKIDRVCMYRRSERPKGDIEDEVFVKTNIIISHNAKTLKPLEETLTSISHLVGPKSPRVIIVHSQGTLQECYKLANTILGHKRFYVVTMIESLYEGHNFDAAFKKTSNGWLFMLESGELVPENMLQVLNHSINHDMSSHIATTGIRSCMCVAYRLLTQITEEYVKPWEELDENYRLYSAG